MPSYLRDPRRGFLTRDWRILCLLRLGFDIENAPLPRYTTFFCFASSAIPCILNHSDEFRRLYGSGLAGGGRLAVGENLPGRPPGQRIAAPRLLRLHPVSVLGPPPAGRAKSCGQIAPTGEYPTSFRSDSVEPLKNRSNRVADTLAVPQSPPPDCSPHIQKLTCESPHSRTPVSTHRPSRADSSTASQTLCVCSALRKSGCAGWPDSIPRTKSARAFRKVCS